MHPNFSIGAAWMAEEFREQNPQSLVEQYIAFLPAISFEPHLQFKQRVPGAVGLIRTAGTAQYSNLILESA